MPKKKNHKRPFLKPKKSKNILKNENRIKNVTKSAKMVKKNTEN